MQSGPWSLLGLVNMNMDMTLSAAKIKIAVQSLDNSHATQLVHLMKTVYTVYFRC